MCGRFYLTSEPGVVARRFGAPPSHGGGRTPRYNIAPTQTVVIVREDGTRLMEDMLWGLVPFWSKDAKSASRMINARAETLAEKPAFREALKKRRCLIPADGFYEWTKGPTGKKAPIRIALESGDLFAFAGLWEEWTAPDGSQLRTTTIVTTEPNGFMAGIHHRMPVILSPEDEAVWLDPTISDPDVLLSLLRPYGGNMAKFEASPLVNSAANEGPQLHLPIPDEQPN